MYIEITSGPGSIQSAAQPILTDANGEARAEYHSPENEGDVGATVEITARYGGD